MPPSSHRDQAGRVTRVVLIDPLGLDTGLAASLDSLVSRMPTQVSSDAPPDPTRPALPNKYADQPILNAPKVKRYNPGKKTPDSLGIGTLVTERDRLWFASNGL